MIALRTLGGFEIVGHDGLPVDVLLAQPKRAALLTYLALASRGAYVRRDVALGLFWPEQSDHRARGALRQALYAVKQDVGSEVIGTRGDEEVRVRPETLSCDALQFDAAIRSDDLERAAGLYGGPFLDGFYLKGCPEFARWAEVERERRAVAYGKALETLVARAAERLEWDAAVDWCRLLATHSPYSTNVVVAYMEAMAAAGNRVGALQYAKRYAARLRDELGAAPSPQVAALAERLRSETPRGELGQAWSVSSSGEDVAAHRRALVEALLRAVQQNGAATVMLHSAIGDDLNPSFRRSVEVLVSRHSDEELVVITDFLRRNAEWVRAEVASLARARKGK